MRILILGGTRFIGAATARRLHALGHEVVVFHRGRSRAPLPDAVRHVIGDLRDLPRHTPELVALQPDLLLDMMALTEAHARHAAAAFAGHVGRAVVISSCDVTRAFGRILGVEPGAPDPVPLTEDAPLRQRWYLNRGAQPRPEQDELRFLDDYEKILVERAYAANSALPVTVLRLPMVFGEGDGQHRMFPYLKRMIDQRPGIVLSSALAEWRGCRGYVENMAEAIVRCVVDARSSGRVYHVADAECPSERDWVRAIAAAQGWPGRICERPESALPPGLQAGIHPEQHLVLDTTRIRAELGYREVVSFDEAVRRTVQWEREHAPAEFDPAAFDYAAEDAILANPPPATELPTSGSE